MKKATGWWTILARGALALLLALSFLQTITAYAAEGDLDPSFDTDGLVTYDMGAADEAWAVAAQPDGKIVVAGGNGSDIFVARYNLNGSLDTSFDTDGIVTTDVTATQYDMARAIALQPDGKILVAGYTTTVLNGDDVVVVRYNTDGGLDTSFGGGDGIVITTIGVGVDRARAVMVLPDGRIAIAGYTYSTGPGQCTEFSCVLAARYASNGDLDTTFDTDGWVATALPSRSSQGFAAVLQPDGKLVVAGNDQGSRYLLVRYNANGSMDAGFKYSDVPGDFPGGIVPDGVVDIAAGNGHLYALALQPDGRIVASGWSNNDIAVARFNTDGTPDTSFSGDGMATVTIPPSGWAEAWGVAVQADGKIVASGRSNSGDEFAVVRLNTNGTPDLSFSTDGIATFDLTVGTSDQGRNMTLLPDGRIAVLGVCNGNFCAIRLQFGDRVWDGGGVGNNWSTAANWVGDTVPTSGQIVLFDSTSSKPATVDSAVTVAGISIGAGYHSVVTLNNSLTVNGQAIIAPSSGLDANGNAFTATALQNNGTITQTLNVGSASTVDFFNTGGYGGVTIASGAALGSTRVIIHADQACDSNNSSVRRCFNITPTTIVSANVTFYYAPGELNGSACGTMNAYHWNGTSWGTSPLNVLDSSCSPAPYWLQVDMNSYSPVNLRSSNEPTVVSITQFNATSHKPLQWLLALGGVLLVGVITLRRKMR